MSKVWINLDNAQQILLKDDTICLGYIYSWESAKFWKVLKPIYVKLSNGHRIVIPKGFTTDMSSSPRWLWSVAPPFGDFLLPALIHDYLYVQCLGTRAAADREMWLWSEVLNSNSVDNFVRYLAVRAFGKSWWKRSLLKFDGQPQPWPENLVDSKKTLILAQN